ncbi:hypothetical protein IC582_012596 [Cucumis melo]
MGANLDVDNGNLEKNPATDTLGPSFFATTLCLTLLNLSFVVSCIRSPMFTTKAPSTGATSTQLFS